MSLLLLQHKSSVPEQFVKPTTLLEFFDLEFQASSILHEAYFHLANGEWEAREILHTAANQARSEMKTIQFVILHMGVAA